MNPLDPYLIQRTRSLLDEVSLIEPTAAAIPELKGELEGLYTAIRGESIAAITTSLDELESTILARRVRVADPGTAKEPPRRENEVLDPLVRQIITILPRTTPPKRS